jgi:DNA-directed RNA polymerase subunit RPC12/RpoP
MANYEYVCHECFLLLPKEFPFGKPKKKVKCPECGKMCEQNWAGRDIPVHFKGAGWTGKNSSTGFNKAGGSDEVNRQLQDNSKLRQESGWQHYAKYTPPQKLLDTARKLTPQEVQQKLEASRKVSDVVYDKAKINPYEQNKKKPQ